MVVRVDTVASSHVAMAAFAAAVLGGGVVVVVVPRASSVVVVVAAFACAASDGSCATTGRKRSSAVLPTSATALARSFTPGRSITMSLPWREISRLDGAEAVDPVADDVDGDVEGIGLVLADRREHHRDAALEVEAEYGFVAAGERREEHADHDDERHHQEDDVPTHGSVVARAVVGGVLVERGVG